MPRAAWTLLGALVGVVMVVLIAVAALSGGGDEALDGGGPSGSATAPTGAGDHTAPATAPGLPTAPVTDIRKAIWPKTYEDVDPNAPEPKHQFQDPVCKKMVTEGEGFVVMFEGTTYHTCCEACRDKFEADPPAIFRDR